MDPWNLPVYAELDEHLTALDCEWKSGEPLAPRTTFKIGGPADRLILVESYEQLSGVLAVLARLEIPWFVLGRGSNLLVSDRGYRGAVLELGGIFTSAGLSRDNTILRCGGGISLASQCVFTRDEGLTGLEFAWGIPGSMGGAVYMNAGAYGGEMKDIVERVWHMDSLGNLGSYAGEELDFGYRHSRYTGSDKIIVRAELRLSPGNKEEIAAKMTGLMERRKEKQPYDMPSAGSTFKRPKEGYAAALIEQCGLKGRSVGGAQVSEKHAGFIVNTGGATCRDVLALMDVVREEVLRQTGVELEPEVRMIGEG